MARYIISDIHGCLKTIKKLLTEIIPNQPNDIYYFLGDYINKGPKSLETINYLMNFNAQNNCVFLKGNHDQLLLDIFNEVKIDFIKVAQVESLYKSLNIRHPKEIPWEYVEFYSAMKCYVELENCILVHAGLNFDLDNIFKDTQAMLNTKQSKYNDSKAKGKTVFHGHVPVPLSQLVFDLKNNTPVISIDTGCVYRMNPELNTLSAIDIDTSGIYTQPNIENPYFINRR